MLGIHSRIYSELWKFAHFLDINSGRTSGAMLLYWGAMFIIVRLLLVYSSFSSWSILTFHNCCSSAYGKFCLCQHNVYQTVSYLLPRIYVGKGDDFQTKQNNRGCPTLIYRKIPRISPSISLCTDVPPPSGKIGRRDVCESPTIIMFPFPRNVGDSP